MFEILTLVSHNFLNISRMVNTTDYISDCIDVFMGVQVQGRRGEREGGGEKEGKKGEEERRRKREDIQNFRKFRKRGGILI